MIKVKFDDKQVKRALRRLDKAVDNVKPALKDIADKEVRLAQNRIRIKKTDPDGRPWRPWSYATLQYRIRQGNVGKGLLYSNGLLARSFDTDVSRNELTVSNSAPYATYLQEGTPNMPSRKFLGWGNKSIKSAADILLKYLKGKLK